jgi:hypothetical protein
MWIDADMRDDFNSTVVRRISVPLAPATLFVIE